jgi:hypothetical protein
MAFCSKERSEVSGDSGLMNIRPKERAALWNFPPDCSKASERIVAVSVQGVRLVRHLALQLLNLETSRTEWTCNPPAAIADVRLPLATIRADHHAFMYDKRRIVSHSVLWKP